MTETLRTALTEAGARHATQGDKCELPILTYVCCRGVEWMLAYIPTEAPDFAYGLLQMPNEKPKLCFMKIADLLAIRFTDESMPEANSAFERAIKLDVRKYAEMSESTGRIALHHTFSYRSLLKDE